MTLGDLSSSVEKKIFEIKPTKPRSVIDTVIRYLVSIGTDIRACDEYAVQWAYINNHSETVKCLISLGANPKALSSVYLINHSPS